MQVTIAKRAGYCFGVKRAMETAESLAEGLKDKRLYTLGDIIHNKEAIKKLAEKGVLSIGSIDEIEKPEESVVLIRAHGVPPQISESLAERGIEYIDCTCPYVKRIHDIVSEAKAEAIIVGDKDHPEVLGINGHADNSAVIINSVSEALQLQESTNKICAVAQTTFNHMTFNEIAQILTQKFPNIKIHNTTCPETEKRQKEALELSRQCDIMLVVGDKKSANTAKLYEICQKNCRKSVFLETILDLQLNNYKINDKIGITAGASTLPETLKEVAQYMSELEKTTNESQNNDDHQSFEEMLNDNLVSLHTGDVVEGIVISVNNDEVSVNLGYKSDGIIERGEFSSDPSIVPSAEVKPGDTIEVLVLRVNDGEGNVLLSKKRLEAQKNMDLVEKAYDDGEILEVKVTEIVKAGLIALYKGIRVFIPYPQISNRFVEDISVYKGTTLNIKILEFDKSKRRIIGGRRELAKHEEDMRRAEVFGKLNVGDKINGTVSRIVAFGAFVDLGGVDGLVHISQMTWGSVRNPKELLTEGQAVTVVVIDVNEEKGKIGLSLKDVNEDPWKNIEAKYEVGSVTCGKIARLAPFGAFVELEEGVDGLVHISQISKQRVEKCEDVLSVGETVSVKVMEINAEKRKISLSIKAANEPVESVESVESVEPVEPVETESKATEGAETENDTAETNV